MDKGMQRRIWKLKKALVSSKVMAHWCQGQKTELVIDRGPEGLATTLYQEEPETGFWRPINYCSRTQTKAEQRYSRTTTKRNKGQPEWNDIA